MPFDVAVAVMVTFPAFAVACAFVVVGSGGTAASTLASSFAAAAFPRRRVGRLGSFAGGAVCGAGAGLAVAGVPACVTVAGAGMVGMEVAGVGVLAAGVAVGPVVDDGA